MRHHQTRPLSIESGDGNARGRQIPLPRRFDKRGLCAVQGVTLNVPSRLCFQDPDAAQQRAKRDIIAKSRVSTPTQVRKSRGYERYADRFLLPQCSRLSLITILAKECIAKRYTGQGDVFGTRDHVNRRYRLTHSDCSSLAFYFIAACEPDGDNLYPCFAGRPTAPVLTRIESMPGTDDLIASDHPFR